MLHLRYLGPSTDALKITVVEIQANPSESAQPKYKKIANKSCVAF